MNLQARASYCAALRILVVLLVIGKTVEAQRSRQFDFGKGNGSNPRGGLIVDASGNFYGSTFAGGVANVGVIFELAPSGETSLYNFTGNGVNADGANPTGDLITDQSGNLYGVTEYGGEVGNSCEKGCGTVFELSPPASQGQPWTEAVLYSFQGSPNDGANPTAGLTMDSSGNLYGTTSSGGTQSPVCPCGTVFELSPPSLAGNPWTENLLYVFQGRFDGSQPLGGVILDQQMNLYGTTSLGGFGAGTIFQLAPAPQGQWSESILHRFGAFDGDDPEAGLTLATNGSFLGTTHGGGAYGQGTVFRLDPPSGTDDWQLGVVHSFDVQDGAGPLATVTVGGPNVLFGTTAGGAINGNGNVFEITMSSHETTFSVLHSFTGGLDGGSPSARVLLSNGGLYGTTQSGGYKENGVAFELKH